MRTGRITRDNRTIIMNWDHALYFGDMQKGFDHYFEAVEPTEVDGKFYVDYSTPRWHKVKGYDLHKVYFPSIPEPVEETQKYLDFAQLKHGDVVLDFGAYSGLSAILFKLAVANEGRVIAIEADSRNLVAAEKNLAEFKNVWPQLPIELIFAAVWNHGEGIQFSSESCMGSAQANIVGFARGTIERVPSYTLSGLANKCKLDRIDFIKVDIEGAESVIFEDADFFDKFRPKIIVEVHNVPANGPMSTEKVKADLAKYGYSFEMKGQLVQCTHEAS